VNGKSISPGMLSRAQGCLLGQLSGDSLGSLVEFRTPEEIRRQYPHGLRELADGGTWNTIAGQPTDDSEMALALARTLVECETYDSERVRAAYIDWLDSRPFDCGRTVNRGLHGSTDFHSQANGAMMRISPLGIFGARCGLEQVADWAKQDAEITHPNLVCAQANQLYAMAIARAIASEPTPQQLFSAINSWGEHMEVDPTLLKAVRAASEAAPGSYVSQQGWVLIAFQNALFQLLHASSLEEGVIDTVMCGGDTDTNAAIAGALLGAVYGRDAIPKQWLEKLLTCRPQEEMPNVTHPRPQRFWPVDALQLAEQLLASTPAPL
jgi:ADP-ribosyl-[dinitrogen reductase] hydrolase